jgi:PAS domain S-box-containing protein
MALQENNTNSLSVIEVLKKSQQQLREHMAQGSSLQEILSSLILSVEEAHQGLRGAVFLLKPGTNLLFKIAAPNMPDEFFKSMENGVPVSGDGAPEGIEIFLKEKVLNPDIASDPFYSSIHSVIHRHNLHSCWTQPIFSNGRAIGTFTMYHSDSRKPSEDELMLLDIIAGMAGMAIELKQAEDAFKKNIEEQKKRQEMLFFLNKASETLSATLDYKVAYEEISDLIVPKLADWFTVEVLNDEGGLDLIVAAHKDPERIKFGLELREQYPPDLDAPTGTAKVLRTGKSELYPAISDEMLAATARDEKYLELVRSVGFHSVMIVPLVASGKILGALSFISTNESNREYDEEDLRLAEDFGRRVALTIENIRLFKEAKSEQERFEMLVESLPQMAWTAAPDGVLNYVNQRWEEYTGRNLVDSKDYPDILHPDDMPVLNEKWPKALREGTVFSMEGRFKKASTGEYRWHLTRAVPLKNESGEITLWIGTSTDIHDTKLTEEKLKEQNKSLEILNKVGKAVSAELDIDKIVQTVTDAATEISHAQFGAFFYNVINEQGESYTLYAISGVPRENFSKFPMPRATGVFHPTFYNEGIVRSDDITKDPRYGKNPPHFGMPKGHLPVKSYLAVPVVSNNGEVLGGLFFGHEKPGIFTETAEQLVAGIASQAAIAVDNSRLFKASKESEERFRVLADAMPQMVWSTKANGDHDYYNQIWYDYTGLSFEETKDTGWSNVLHPEDYERAVKVWNTCLKTGDNYEIEYRMRRFDGEYRWFLARALPLKNEAGEITRWFGTCTDIHDNKLLEEDLRTVQAELEQRVEDRTVELSRANKSLEKYNVELINAREIAEDANRAKSAFLSSMSHELRTPLNAILGFAQILKKDKAIPEKQRGFVETMYKSGTHLLDMINDVLDISKIESGKMQLFPESFDLTILLEDLQEIFKQQASDKELEFLTSFPASPFMIFADSKRIRQILMNLLSNAVKFTARGQISFVVTIEESFKRDNKDFKTVSFVIKDTGRGIAPEQHQMIFEPFRQVSDTYSEGTGLGLAISKRIASLMGGEILLESAAGKGSNFIFRSTFEIPAIDTKAFTNVPDVRIVGITNNQQVKVLIVDDVESNRLVARTILEPAGFFCAEANDGRSAVIIAEQFQPDIILMDLLMPIMNGYESVSKMRQLPLLRETPIIAITASGFEGKREEVLRQGFNEYIRKPFQVEELFSAISTLLKLEYVYEPDDSAKPSLQFVQSEKVELSTEIAENIKSLEYSLKTKLCDAIEIQDFDTILTILRDLESQNTLDDSFKQLQTAAQTADFKLMAGISEKLRT